ncbi:hypothetical protein, partial [Streptomyces sp. NPDC053813]|uniref:hypothetical protein n=1 Tax=Streptomyces sp. NPDC053813 TaxID=3365717 RepID=UPI0037D70E6B
MTTTPIDLFASALPFRPDGDVRAADRQMTSSDSGAWQIATFHVETDADVHADHWEMHPEAEEAVCCLTGGVRLYFRATTPGGAEDMVQLQAGTAVSTVHREVAGHESGVRGGRDTQAGRRRVSMV